jgi:hypothetical protein
MNPKITKTDRGRQDIFGQKSYSLRFAKKGKSRQRPTCRRSTRILGKAGKYVVHIAHPAIRTGRIGLTHPVFGNLHVKIWHIARFDDTLVPQRTSMTNKKDVF